MTNTKPIAENMGQRVIKFRGKRVDNGEWVYGFAIANINPNKENETFDNWFIYEGINIKDSIEVIPETVGQYTGLLDKNGKEIYEGDIVRILYTDWCSKSENDPRSLVQYLIDISSIGVISFYDGRYCVKMYSTKYSDYNYSSIFPGTHGFIEIIGNIHETPELLEQKVTN